MKKLSTKYNYDISDPEELKSIAHLRRINSKLATKPLEYDYLCRQGSDVWININGNTYLYSFDSNSDYDYYESKYGKNKGRLISQLKPFCKGKVKGPLSYE